MHFKNLKVGALVCVSGVYAASIHAEEPAQSDMDAQGRPIEETLVRGQYLQSSQINALRSPTPILDVPQSLSIITSDVIMERGYTAVSEIIEYLPGVMLSSFSF